VKCKAHVATIEDKLVDGRKDTWTSSRLHCNCKTVNRFVC
jgi:hypothetical protein